MLFLHFFSGGGGGGGAFANLYCPREQYMVYVPPIVHTESNGGALANSDGKIYEQENSSARAFLLSANVFAVFAVILRILESVNHDIACVEARHVTESSKYTAFYIVCDAG